MSAQALNRTHVSAQNLNRTHMSAQGLMMVVNDHAGHAGPGENAGQGGNANRGGKTKKGGHAGPGGKTEKGGHAGPPLRQRNYYERIIRNDDELRRARIYIEENPARWAMDRENPANHP